MSEYVAYMADRRALFEDLRHIVEAHRADAKKLAVLLVNINHFRQINVACGYEAGDQLLEEFASRLRELCRDQDYLARMGNAEFILLLPDIINEGHVRLAAHKLLGCLDEPFDLCNHRQKITANMGIALFPDNATDIAGLIQKAEIALMDARHGIQLYSIYSEKQRRDDFNIWDIEVELQNAQDRDEFELFFQPQLSLQNGQVFGAEALLRWKSRNRGYVRPDVFIPLAEHNGQIHSITWWTINAALRLIKDWPKTSPPMKVAVNISARVLRDPELVESIRSALSIWGSEAEQLTLEITESALMEDMATSFITLEELRSLGLNISIDDFGTGYSSMAYFKYIPANELKIDHSFVCHMLENAMDQHIVRTITEMAHGFDLEVVAEGIENQQTLDALKELGCDIAQGYHLARPMPHAAFLQWLEDYRLQQKD